MTATTLRPYHAEDIAAGMAGTLEDDKFMRIYRHASLEKQAATPGPLESQVRKLIADWDAALKAGTLGQIQDRAAAYNHWFAGGPATTALQRELDQTYGDMQGSTVFGNLKSEMESLATAQAADDAADGGQCAHDEGETCAACDGQAAEDPRKLPTGSTGDPIQGIEITDKELEDMFGKMPRKQQQQAAAAADFAIRHLGRLANALDTAGFSLYADQVDATIGKIAGARPKVSVAAKKKKSKGDGKPGRSYKEWLKALPAGKDKEAFEKRYKGALEHAKKKGMDKKKAEEYAARTAIDKLPKKYLKEPTGVHGPGKSGKKVKK